MIRRFVSMMLLCGALAGPGAALAQDRDDHRTPEEERGMAFQRVRGATREHVPGGKLMIIAYGAVWVAIFGYVVAQWRGQSRVRDDLARLERALEEDRKKG